MKIKKMPPKLQDWINTKKRHHLSDMHVQMARAIGLNPKKLGKLDNHKKEKWKDPLPEFIERIYQKSFGKTQPDDIRSIEQIFKEQQKKKAAKRVAKLEAKQIMPPNIEEAVK
jgi:hypothetical protein